MLYGRDAECAAVERLLEGARASRSGVLVVRGEPGLGKSALLADAVERAAGFQVLQGLGVASESELAFAGLHRLLRPAFGLIDRLPDPQAAALRGAFGRSGDGTHNRFFVSIAVLSLLAEAAERGPLLCVVDDGHWLDRPSADALRFCARRLDAEGVALLIAAGEDTRRSFHGADLPVLRLAGLDVDAAGRLLRARAGAPVATDVLERLVEESEGNPLALIELSRVLSMEQLAGREALPVPLPIGADLEHSFLERVALLAPHSRSALLLVAADGTGDPTVLSRAARATEVDLDLLAPAEAAGFVRMSPSGVEFRHPLVRSAIYGGASPAERRAAHRALAGVLDEEADADRRAWHLAAATVGPDREVADELERSAERAGRRGGHGAAMEALERAADLSVDEEDRARRLAAGADAAWRASLPERAIVLLERASRVAHEPRVRAELDHLRGVIAHGCGVPAEGCAILLQAAAILAPTDPDRALEMLLDAGDAATYAGDAAALVEACRRAAGLRPGAEGANVLVGLLCGVASLLEGETADQMPALRAGVARAASFEDPRWLAWAGSTAALVGDDATGSALYIKAVTRARASAAVTTLTRVLEVFTFAGMLEGRYGAVAADATEGVQLARDAGLENSACHHLATLAWLAAIRGQEARCRSLTGEVAVAAAARGLGLQRGIAEWALALLDLGLGRPAQALRRLRRLNEAGPGAGHPFIAICATPDLIESAVRAGRPDDAHAAWARFERFARAGAPPWAPPLAARCRALLAADTARDRHFRQALTSAAQSRRAFDTARSELLFGEHLRRTRRRVQARDHLHAALAEFERLGAAPWEERAHRELRASGQTARKRDPSTVDQLTAQEVQIARFVATGATNRDVAAQLFLSKRTVDYHLRRIFAKLAISSRSELTALELESSLGSGAGLRRMSGA
jgi:DNA-binding CsgD family transcriptional regulator